MFGQSLLSAFGSAACTTDTDQLFTTDVQTTSVATYQLNNATTSIPSNTYPGTPSGITYAAGKFGNAAVFNGSSSYIYLGNSAFQYTSLTISAWIYPTAASSGIILENYESGGSPQNSGWVFRFNSDGTILFGGYGSGAYGLFTTSAVSLNTWTNVTVTFSPTSSAIYFNGVAQSTSSSGWSSPYGTLQYSTGGNNNGNPTNIGRQSYTGGSTNYFTGRIDQVRVFNSVLQQAAVTALYNETTTTATYSYVEYEGANTNSIAYYKMSDATDQLGNYNGTATNVNFNTEGKFGFAGAFNGTSSTIATPITTNYSNLSISCWVKFDALPTGGADATLVSKGFYTSGSSTQYLHLRYEDYLSKGFTFAIRNNSAYNSQAIAGVTATVGVWYHVVGILDSSGNAQIYVNGVAGTGITGAPSMTNSNAFEIGSFISTSALLNGSIDQIRIYDSALSAANVTTLYNEIECPAVAVTNAFNSVIYTGTGSTQAVTGTGFEPDFVWIKDRTSANSHILQDSVRGANKALLSNTTNAEITSTDFFTSFDSNGFTLPSNTGQQTNKLNNNYVSWNWKAPLANLSTGFNGSSSEIVAANSILPSSGGFAISWWQKTTQADNTYSYTIDTGGASLGNGIYIITHNVSTGLTIGFKNGSTFGSSSIPYTSSERKQWTHFCFSWDGTTSTDAFKIYKNNVATSFTSTVTNGGSAYPFRIGRSYNGTDWFGGSIGQVRIYSSALSASEVSDLYAEPAASNNTLNYPAGAGCIAAYPLQTDAVDLSGNYNGASSNVTFGQPGYLTGNTNGTIPSTVAANVDAGFSITKYTGNGTSGATFAHGLGKQVEISIVKNVGSSGYWYVYSNLLPTNNNLYLNTSDSKQADGVMLGGNSTTVSISASSAVNTNNGSYIAYNFTSIPGYSRVGSYVGTGASGNFIYTGFQTSFVMIKRTDSAGNWLIFDSGRGAQYELYANLSDSEYNAGGGSNSFSATGFTPQTAGAWNLNGATYIYLAIA